MKRSAWIWILIAALAAAQAVGLFLLVRTAPATSLTLSETELILKRDEGRRITHTVEPDAAKGKLIRYKVSASDEIIAWVDDQNEMIVAVSPGVCTIKAQLDGQEAAVSVTVAEESILAGDWRSDDAALSLDGALSGMLELPEGSRQVRWFRGAFPESGVSNPYRFVRFTGAWDKTPLVLYYDRLSDTLRLHVDGTDAETDRMFVRS